MALIDKVPQKFLHLKSKGIITNFFITLSEERRIELFQTSRSLAKENEPIKYTEKATGNYLVTWNDNTYSKGKFTVSDIEEMSFFVENSRKSAKQYSQIYFPNKTIYPIVRAYSKKTSDYIDSPDFLFKLSNLFNELDDTTKNTNSNAHIQVIDCTKYAFSANNPSEEYTYSKFIIRKNFLDLFFWEYQTIEAPSQPQLIDILSFFGDVLNLIQTKKSIKLKKDTVDLFIPPHVFEKLFSKCLLDQINGDRIIQNLSKFNLDDLKNKKRILGLVSISYDPLINLKLGTYSFTSFGLKAQKQYFIKAGRVELPILNEINYAKLGFTTPTMEFINFENVKIEGLSKFNFKNLRSIDSEFIYITNIKSVKFLTSTELAIISNNSLFMTDYKKICKLDTFIFKFDLLDCISNRQIELIEFVDGKIGARLKNVSIKFI